LGDEKYTSQNYNIPNDTSAIQQKYNKLSKKILFEHKLAKR